MIIKRFVIVDLNNGLANEFNFSPNSNVIFSRNGTVGKSSLLKSIYYCLGMDIKNFTKTWNYNQMIFKIYFSHNNQDGWIIRHKNFYKVYDTDAPLSESEYSRWFTKLLDMQIKIRIKDSENLSQVHAAAILSLFYVDQDSSWKGVPFRNTANLNWYNSKDMPQSIFEYVLNLKSNEHLEKEEKRGILKNELSQLINTCNSLIALKDQFILTDKRNLVLDEDGFKEDLKKYLLILESLNDKISTYNEQIYKKQVELDSLKLELRELNDILKCNNKLYKNNSIKCSKCNSFLTEQQSEERMKLDYSSFLLSLNIKEIELKINEAEQSIRSLLDKKLGLDKEYNKLSKQLQMKSSRSSINEFIQSLGEATSQDKYYKILGDLEIKKSDIEDEIKKINTEIKKLTIEQNNRRSEIDSYFTDTFNKLASNLPSVDRDFKFLKFNQIKNSGSALNQIFLVIYLTYIKILMEYSSVELPFVMDSIIKDELDGDVLSGAYSLVNKIFLSSKKQTFFAALDDKFQYLTGKCNKIEIKSDQKLLNKESFDRLKKEIGLLNV